MHPVVFKQELDFWMPKSDTHFSTVRRFELDHCREVQRLIRSGRRMIDGGAHVGSWSRELSTRFGQIDAFEPDSVNFECLVRNAQTVNAHNCALGETSGMASMEGRPGNSGAQWLIEGVDFHVVPLDSFEFDDVDFIKLDVEGYEPYVLRGAAETIAACHPVVLIEQTPKLSGRYEFDHLEGGRILEQWGYRLHVKLNKNYIYVDR